ncbi:MAG: DUF2911 domain-containing protein [Bacteroidetes bacterium]|nr:MAG: DUF2911 domain-containing protein [Bacteroidota bacterium]
MNTTLRILSLSLVLALAACAGNNTASQSAASEAVTPPAAAPIVGSGTIKVLNDTIPSPRKQMTATIEGVEVTLTYGSPAIKGRALWGGLVPYGEVWRTGANEATTITFSAPVKIGGQALAAGTYGLFSLPSETDWTIIFNSVADQWGAYEYDETKDVLRTKVVPKTSTAASETMEFNVTDGNTIVMMWGNLVVPFVVTAG